MTFSDAVTALDAIKLKIAHSADIDKDSMNDKFSDLADFLFEKDAYIDELRSRVAGLKLDNDSLETEKNDIEEREVDTVNWGNENLAAFTEAVISKNLHDRIKIAAFSNLYRNLSLEEIEELDKRKQREYNFKRKPYITH